MTGKRGAGSPDDFPFDGPRSGPGWEWPGELTPVTAAEFLHDVQTAVDGLDIVLAQNWLDDIECPLCKGKFGRCGHCPENLRPVLAEQTAPPEAVDRSSVHGLQEELPAPRPAPEPSLQSLSGPDPDTRYLDRIAGLEPAPGYANQRSPVFPAGLMPGEEVLLRNQRNKPPDQEVQVLAQLVADKELEITRLKAELYDRDNYIRRLVAMIETKGFS